MCVFARSLRPNSFFSFRQVLKRTIGADKKEKEKREVGHSGTDMLTWRRTKGPRHKVR